MAPVIEHHLDEIERLCRQYQVSLLEIFGSATNPDLFNTNTSDIDFLVSFLPTADLGPWLKLYFDFHDELEKLLGRSVDLAMHDAMRNPIFINQANLTRRTLYAAASSKVA